YFEVGEALPDDSFRPMGLLLINRPVLPVAETDGRGEIVLDFGTSNSAVLFYRHGVNRQFIKSGVREIEALSSAYFLTYKETEFNNLLRAVAILSPWNLEHNPQPFLPSLLADPDRLYLGSCACIPSREHGLSLLTGPQSRVKSGLKWKDWTAPGIVERIEFLVELLLLPAFWELRVQGCSSSRLTAAYPLAFDDYQRSTYKEILGKVTHTLTQRTELHVVGEGEGKEPIFLISESAAGAALLPKTQATHEVALDMGGGTTDMAVQVGASGKDATGQDMGAIIAADSIEYAGRDFLRAVITAYGPDLLRKVLTHSPLDLLPKQISPPDPRHFEGEPGLLADAYVDCLEAVLHRHGAQGLQSLLKHVPEGLTAAEMKLRQTDVKIRWEALLGGFLFYVRRVVEACLSNIPAGRLQEVQFNLLGQGWELLRVLGPDFKQPVNVVLEPCLCVIGSEIARSCGSNLSCKVFPMPSIQNPKTAVVEGGDKIRQSQGDILGEKGEIKGALFDLLAANTRKTFVGMDIYDEQGKATIRWNARIETSTCRPNWPGDPGYGKLIDELFEFIKAIFSRPDVPFKTVTLIKERLFNSEAYRQQYSTHDVRKHLISRGQDDLNRKTWLPRNPIPVRSLLAGFLVSVWRPVWASTKL
ncbi:MAG: hypothetical protein V1897_07920, partial [Pseudomonadota bacterium]